MNSLQRMKAAIDGKPFDQYPYLSTYPAWSMLPYMPELTGGLSWVHAHWGTDEERIRCAAALTEGLGIDWMLPPTQKHEPGRFEIEMDGDVPILVDKIENTRTRKEEFPSDDAVTEPKFTSARQVEALPAVATAETLVDCDFEITREMANRYGQDNFLVLTFVGPFAHCYYNLGFDGLMQAIASDPALMSALLERHTESLVQRAKAAAQVGVHAVRFFEIFCSADMIAEADYLKYAFPYEQRVVRAIRDAGLTSIMEMMGWAEPRLPHIARLGVDVFYADATLKGQRNDIAEFRNILGEEVCILGNIHAYDVIERGDEATWRRAIEEQARGVGTQRRYGLCNGTPTTWATPPKRLRRFGDFARRTLAEITPPQNPPAM